METGNHEILSPAQDVTVPMTTVKVQFTEIKFYNDEINNVETLELLGKIPVGQCKDHVKSLGDKNIYISKATTNVEFDVNTAALYALKA